MLLKMIKLGNILIILKLGVDLATGKPYQERRRGFQTAKEAFEARTRALNKVQQKGSIKHTQWTFKQIYGRSIYAKLLRYYESGS